MPSSTRRQQRFMYVELARKQAGQATKTGMTFAQLFDYTGKVKRKKGKKH